MMQRILPLVVVAALAPSAALEGQPPRSDDTGPPITGSGVAGAGYPGAAFRNLEDALFRPVSGGTAFRSVAVADAMLGAAEELGGAVCRGEAPPPLDWSEPFVPDTVAQRGVCALLRDALTEPRLLRVLTGDVPGPHVQPASELVQGLRGILAGERRLLDARGRWVEAGAWKRVLEAYDRYIARAPAALLDPPAPELVVIGSMLQRVVAAGLEAAER